jgi:hypothetical protein
MARPDEPQCRRRRIPASTKRKENNTPRSSKRPWRRESGKARKGNGSRLEWGKSIVHHVQRAKGRGVLEERFGDMHPLRQTRNSCLVRRNIRGLGGLGKDLGGLAWLAGRFQGRLMRSTHEPRRPLIGRHFLTHLSPPYSRASRPSRFGPGIVLRLVRGVVRTALHSVPL